jgi:integrase
MIEGYSLPNKKLTPHMFRHTFCKWMLKATNNDIEKVDGWLVIAILRQLLDI